MKRILSALVMSVVVLSFTGCGKGHKAEARRHEEAVKANNENQQKLADKADADAEAAATAKLDQSNKDFQSAQDAEKAAKDALAKLEADNAGNASDEAKKKIEAAKQAVTDASAKVNQAKAAQAQAASVSADIEAKKAKKAHDKLVASKADAEKIAAAKKALDEANAKAEAAKKAAAPKVVEAPKQPEPAKEPAKEPVKQPEPAKEPVKQPEPAKAAFETFKPADKNGGKRFLLATQAESDALSNEGKDEASVKAREQADKDVDARLNGICVFGGYKGADMSDAENFVKADESPVAEGAKEVTVSNIGQDGKLVDAVLPVVDGKVAGRIVLTINCQK